MPGSIDLDLRSDARTRRLALDVPGHLHRAAICTWSVRMVNEYMSSHVFAALAEQMSTAGHDGKTVRRCRQFSDEEKKHGVMCGAVVEALGGEARASAAAPPEFPLHADVSAQEGVLRNLLSICCLSETVAVALIGADRLEMPEGKLHRLLTEIYADEIGHARFGWIELAKAAATLDEEARGRLSAYLCVAFACLEAHELAHLPESSYRPPDGETVGLCRGADARTLFYDTVHQIIVPGLSNLGLDGEEAWARRASFGSGRASRVDSHHAGQRSGRSRLSGAHGSGAHRSARPPKCEGDLRERRDGGDLEVRDCARRDRQRAAGPHR